MESRYDDLDEIRKLVGLGNHRDVIGGLWDEIGKLQFDFLVSEGLRPHHKLLDLGCRCLRAGIHLVPYLNPGNYFGLDSNQSLLVAGYEIELVGVGAKERLPPDNLICNANFELPVPDETFDFALAQSVFTHVKFGTIQKCLKQIVRTLKVNGAFYATFNELPEDAPSDDHFRREPSGIVTYGSKDPYHYRFRELQGAAGQAGWAARNIGDWNHPRGQHMLEFVRQNGACHSSAA
jgi:SAM-dependent methyltransferase